MKVEVEVEAYEVLREIDTDDLESELRKRRDKERPRHVKDIADKVIEAIDHDLMETALYHWERGRRDDAIYFLEQALGRHWNGLAAMTLRVAA